MKNGIKATILAASMLATSPAMARTTVTDWREYGTTLNHDVVCSYDAAGVDTDANGLIRAWTRCIKENPTTNLREGTTDITEVNCKTNMMHQINQDGISDSWYYIAPGTLGSFFADKLCP